MDYVDCPSMNAHSGANSRAAGYRADIDGLRAVAILSVVAYHYWGSFGGYVGVDVFFVISGYLITGIILRELHSERFSLLEFYGRRVRRILPPVMIVIITCLAVGWLWLPPDDLRPLAENAAAGAVFLSNFLSWSQSGYFDAAAQSKPLLHLWSLAIEEQFYLLWPVLLLAIAKLHRGKKLAIGLLAIFSFAVNIRLTNHYQTAAFYLPASRVWELAVGGLLAWCESQAAASGILDRRLAQSRHWVRIKDWQSIVGMLIVIACALGMMQTPSYPGYLAIAPVFGAALILAAGPDAVVNSTILSSGPATFLGRISYGLYLWHWPVLVFASLLFWNDDFSPLQSACLLAVAVGLSILTYFLVERPIRFLAANRKSSAHLIVVGVTASVLVAVVAYQISAGALARSSDAHLITRKDAEPWTGCWANANNRPANAAVFAPCEKVKYPGRPVVFLVGDSFSVSLYQGLQPYLDRQQMNLIEYSVIFCTPLSLKDQRTACVDYNRYIRERIASQKPQMVIISANHLLWAHEQHANEPDYVTYIRKTAESLMNAGVPHVVLIGEVPTWHAALPRLLNLEYLRHGGPMPERMLTGLVQESLQVDSNMKAQTRGSPVTYYSVRDALCNAQGCVTRLGDHLPEQLIVFDYGHLTGAGATYVIKGGLGATIMAEINP